MQKVAEPSRRSGAVTEYLCECALAHEASAQEDRAWRAKLESQLQQLREQSERREVESAELWRDWPPWKGRKKRGSEPTG